MQNIFLLLTLFLTFFAAEGFCLNNVWSPPFTLSATASSINIVRSPIAIDTHSNTIVGWLPGPFPTSASEILSAYLPAGTIVWNAPEIIATATPPQFPAFPLLFTDMDDNQTVAWGDLDFVGGNVILQVSKRPSNAIGWPAPISLDLNGLTSGGGAQAGELGNLLAFVAVASGFSPPYTLEFSTLTTSKTAWSPIQVLGMDNSPQPVLANSVNSGRSILIWRTDTPVLSMHSMRYSFSNNRLIPASDIALPVGITDVVNLQVEMDQAGNAIAFFTLTDGIGFQAYAATLLADSTTWSTLIPISNPSNNAFALSVELYGNNSAILLWGEQTLINDGYIFAADLPLGGVPNTVQLAGPFSGTSSIDASSNVVVDSFGNAVAIWGIVATGGSFVQVDSKVLGESWAAPETLSLTGKTPKVVLSDQETAVAIWIDTVSENLLSSTNLAIFNLHSPTDFIGKVVKNQFLTSTNYALKMHWNSDRILNVDTFEIRNNGNLVAVIPGSEPHKSIISLSSKDITGIYTLTSIATNGNESLPVPLTITN